MGNALIGDFTAQSSSDEILLINHLDEHEVETQANDHLLVKKSVLICKKHAADKHSIHRLRVDEPASKDKARRSKRGRSSREKGESPAVVRYIERIKFGSKQRANGNGDGGDEGDGDDTRSSHLVSQSQLVQLTKSLEKRLESGIHELDRLKLIVADKRDTVNRLNHFVEDEWWRSQRNQGEAVGKLPVSAVYHGEAQRTLKSGIRSGIVMQTLVSADEDTHITGESAPLSPAYSLKTLVTMEDFRIVEFIPSASLFRLQVTMGNRSPDSLRNAFISLVSKTSSANDSSSAVVSGIQSSSSVQLDFRPETEKTKGLISFVLDAQLPPTFAILRAKPTVKASIWLHCDTREQHTASDSRGDSEASTSAESSACSLFVGSMTISPHEFVFSQESVDHQRSSSAAAKGTSFYIRFHGGEWINNVRADSDYWCFVLIS